MKHYAYYLPSGEISACSTLPDDVDPAGLNGLLHIETPSRISGDTHWVSSGELRSYTQQAIAAKMSRPLGRGYEWRPATNTWADTLAGADKTARDAEVAQMARRAAYPSAQVQLDALWAELAAAPGGLKTPAAQAVYARMTAANTAHPKPASPHQPG